MMLKDKVAVTYGGGGAIGGAVARAFAREGAKVFLTGRRRAAVEAVAKDIVSAGGSAQAAEVDALDEQAVDQHLQSVIDKVGRVDISFNAIGIPDKEILGVPLTEMSAGQFSLPITTYTTSYFLTARLAARRMILNKSGVIMTVTALPSAEGHPIERRLRSGAGRQGGNDSRSIVRTRTSGHSRGRSATTRHPGDKHDDGSLRHQGQGIWHNLGTVPAAPRKRHPRATGHDARGDG
jgi:NAD(P)-dependent dehydrogenase (short-subunit alcohol dehydrogenase family)